MYGTGAFTANMNANQASNGSNSDGVEDDDDRVNYSWFDRLRCSVASDQHCLLVIIGGQVVNACQHPTAW